MTTAATDRRLRALLDAILDDPDDDAVRLIFADRCEELGEVERSEFIRLQIELHRIAKEANHPGRYLANSCKCKWCELAKPMKRRESELFPFATAAHEDVYRLLGEATGRGVDRIIRHHERFTGNACMEWHRGFPEQLIMPCEAFVRHAGAVFLAQPVTRVVLSDKRPRRGSRGYYWFNFGNLGCQPHDLPTALWSVLSRSYQSPIRPAVLAYYDSDSGALDALSAACVLHGTAGRARLRRERSDR